MKRINVKCKFCGVKNNQGKSYCDFGCRFKKYTSLKKENGCIEWKGSRDVYGYGQFCIKSENETKNKFVFAHRESYRFFNGELPEKLNVCHRCDNPCCVNPKHLWIGTHQQNHKDMHKKGREEHGAPKGKFCHSAKINEEKVRIIRKMLNAGYSQTEVGRIFGIGQASVWKIKNWISWKHVKD